MSDLADTLAHPRSLTWLTAAACRNIPDPDIFFPSQGKDGKEAKAICRGCTVRDECLAYAERHHERIGIWGGMTERERRLTRLARHTATSWPDATTPPPDLAVIVLPRRRATGQS